MTRREAYQRYLQSPHWQRLRATKLRKKQTCSICQSAEQIHIHHLQYRHWWNVKSGDLRRLCAECHATAHDLVQRKVLVLDPARMSNQAMFQATQTAVRIERQLDGLPYGQTIYPETKQIVDRHLDSLSPFPF